MAKCLTIVCVRKMLPPAGGILVIRECSVNEQWFVIVSALGTLWKSQTQSEAIIIQKMFCKHCVAS